MNAIDKTREMFDDDARFDRLVDGELTADEYRALVAGLDDEPGGWRRCALAFLEAQALGGELAAIRRSGQLHDLAAEPVTPRSIVPTRSASWKLLLAMSASFLVAFILGMTLPSLWPSITGRGGGDVVAVGPADWQPGVTGPENLMQSIGNAQVFIEGPGGTQSPTGEVPIYELPSWLTLHEPVLPAELVNELQRRGHRVQRREQYVPVSLEDGRQGIVPVESYQITPVSRRAY